MRNKGISNSAIWGSPLDNGILKCKLMIHEFLHPGISLAANPRNFGGNNMNRISKKRAVNLNKVMAVMTAIAISITIIPGFVAKAHSNKGAAFLGGILAGGLVSGAVSRDKERTQATEYQAYSQPRTTTQAAPAPATQPTAEQRIKQLDKLAAGGYITPAEYKTKKKAILNDM
jgi:hypothetical protein